MANKKLCKVKRVETKMTCVRKKNPIKVTQKDVDELNRKIREDLVEVEAQREAGWEIAKKCIMK